MLRIVERIGFLMCLLTHLKWRQGGKLISLHRNESLPVVLLLKVAHRDKPSTATNGKLVLCENK